MFVDSARSSIATLAGNPQPLSSRSSLLAQFLASAEVRAEIDKKMGLPPNSIPVISSPNTVQAAQDNLFSTADQVASGGSQGTYSITFQPQLELPIIDIYTRGPDAAGAIKLADIAAQSLSEQIQKLGDTSGVPRDSPSRIVMREIGPATGGQVSSHIAVVRLLLTFLGVFLVWCITIVFFTWLRADWQRTAALAEHETA